MATTYTLNDLIFLAGDGNLAETAAIDQLRMLTAAAGGPRRVARSRRLSVSEEEVVLRVTYRLLEPHDTLERDEALCEITA